MEARMLDTFSAWVESTAVNGMVQNVLWIIPTVQTVHILAIAAVLSSVTMISLRVVGLAGGMLSMSDTSRRFLPWLWVGLVTLAVTGVILIIGEPGRSLMSPVFQAKMAMLVVALAGAFYFAHTLRRNVATWEIAASGRVRVRAAAVVTILLWFAIAIAGRWIAYVEVGAHTGL
jgi:hypothetical protein